RPLPDPRAVPGPAQRPVPVAVDRARPRRPHRHGPGPVVRHRVRHRRAGLRALVVTAALPAPPAAGPPAGGAGRRTAPSRAGRALARDDTARYPRRDEPPPATGQWTPAASPRGDQVAGERDRDAARHRPGRVPVPAAWPG